jgi:hypothetical protein
MAMTEEERKERKRERNKKYRDKNKDKREEYIEKNKDKIKEYHKNYNKNYERKDIEKRKEYHKTYERKDIEKRKEYNREYYREYERNRKFSDPFFKMIRNIRSRTTQAVKKYSLSKTSGTMKMLGCDKNTLMGHLQKTGELYDSNFNVYDYDSSLYHIDHKKTFQDVQKGIYTLEEVCHYTNLQILPSEINLSKGGMSW